MIVMVRSMAQPHTQSIPNQRQCQLQACILILLCAMWAHQGWTTDLRKGSLAWGLHPGGPPWPAASERAMSAGVVIAWPKWSCLTASSGSLGKSIAKVPSRRGENDSEGASPTDEQPLGDGTEGSADGLKAVIKCCMCRGIVRLLSATMC